MPSFKQCETAATSILRYTPHAVINFVGAPGLGKSACSLKVGANLELPDDRVFVVHVNNHDIVDFTGVPSVTDDGMTIFNPPKMFYDFREGTGAGLIVLEELAQSSVHHQTWAAGFILERETSTFKLDPEVRIICTGNRAQDKAGAKPLLGHLNDRMYHFDMETSLDDWSAHAMESGVDPMGVAFIRLRPDLLNNYDPAKRSNGTQRSWYKLFTEVPTDMPTDLYMMTAEGKVGEGNAAEWVAARDMMHKMPSIDSIRLHPDNAEVPTEPAVRFAVATALSMTTTPDAFPRDMQYVVRMPKEFQMVYMKDALRIDPKLQQTKAFIDWAIANKNIFAGGN
tara:strand:+ start:45 stop:1061 length:1017 start_codon:yes stop_codon:yes gene_type:complete